MAQLVIAAAGAGLGIAAAPALGITAGLGAQLGWFAGSLVGAAFAPTQKVQGPLLTDLRVTGTEYGQPIAYVQGHPRIAGQIWWASDRRAIATTTSSGGKGGGGGVEQTTYTYEVDLLIGLTDNEIAGVSRIWSNGKLVWTNLASASAASISASNNTDLWSRMTVYTGTSTQLPDPTYEAAVGSANAVAYRNRAYVFIQALQLGGSGQIPNLTFEVQTNASFADPGITPTALYHFNGSYADAQGYGADWVPAGGTGFDTAVKKFGSASIDFSGGTAASSLVQGAGIVSTSEDDPAVAAFFPEWGAGLSAWTIDFQVKIDLFPAAGEYPELISAYPQGLWGSTVRNYRIRINGDTGDLEWHYDNVGSGSTYFISGPMPDDGQWHHIALVNLGGGISNQVHLCIDGVSQGSTNAPGTTGRMGRIGGSGQTNLTIGISRTSPYHVLDGKIDELRSVIGTAVWTTFPFTPPTIEYGSETDVLTPSDEDLDTVVSRLCLRTGLSASQYDVSDLSSITKQVRALAVSQVSPVRQTLELLMSTHFFEMTVSDKIYFVPRGGSAAATLAYDDLGVSENGDKNIEPLALKQANELEIPAQIQVSYINVDNDYQTDTQNSDRLLTAAETVSTVQLPIGLTPAEAKAIADTMLLDQAASMISTKLALLGDYARLEPTDVVIATDDDGSTYRLRLVKKTDAYPLLQFDAVLDDASVLSTQGITSADYTSSTVVNTPPDTEIELMDIPILRDADDDSGFYVAAKGDASPWPGAALMKSVDDIQFDTEDTVTESGVFGTCTSTLDDWTGPRVFDEISSVTVNVGDATLSSSTRTAILNSQSVNAMLIGSEIIQFRTATLVSAGVYTLSSLLRGCRGTEWAMVNHSASERCVLLQTTGLRRLPMQTNELGVSRYYRGVTLGRRLSTATSESFTNNAVGLKPFSGVGLKVLRDINTGDVTISWTRRSRLAVRMIGALGISVPLGEETESYEVDIIAPGSPTTVLRTITSTTTSVTYTAAQQAADMGSPTTDFSVAVYQLSAVVGRGYALEGTS